MQGSQRRGPNPACRPSRNSARRLRFRQKRRGVSDVIATILLLGITITLFSAVFIFVNRFPHPPAQSTSQFQTNLVQLKDCSGTTQPTGLAVQVTLLSGPAVPGVASVFLRTNPTSAVNWQYALTSGVPVPWGFTGAHNSTNVPWTAGQTWCTYLKTGLGASSLTVSVVSSSLLLYQNTVPGSTTSLPEVITRTWTYVTQPQVKSNFTIYALFAQNLSVNATVRISLAGIPGLTPTVQNMTFSATLASYQVLGGLTTTPGTYIAFINGTTWSGTTKQTFTATVTVTLLGQTGCGSGVSITVSPSPNPPTLRTYQSPIATITNTGSSSVTVTSLTFYANYTFSNATPPLWTSPASSLVTVAIGGSAKFSPSTPWMPGPKVGTSSITLTAVASFCSGPSRSISGSQVVTFSPPPFSVSLTVTPTATPATPNSTYRLTFSVTNYGALNGSKVVGLNVTLTGISGGTGGTASCKPSTAPYYSCFFNPPGFGTASATGIAVVAANPLSLSSFSSATGILYLVGPGGSSLPTVPLMTLAVTVTLSNPAWSSFVTAQYTFPASFTFQA